jgi:NUDIX domain
VTYRHLQRAHSAEESGASARTTPPRSREKQPCEKIGTGAANMDLAALRSCHQASRDRHQMSYVQELRSLVGRRPLILPSAGALVFDQAGRVLLQRRADDATWNIPGGAMEPGEALEQTAKREVREETGLDIGDLKLLCVLSGPQFFHVYHRGTRFITCQRSTSPNDLAEHRVRMTQKQQKPGSLISAKLPQT